MSLPDWPCLAASVGASGNINSFLARAPWKGSKNFRSRYPRSFCGREKSPTGLCVQLNEILELYRSIAQNAHTGSVRG